MQGEKIKEKFLPLTFELCWRREVAISSLRELK